MSRPDIKVIDRAIWSIQHYAEKYSCIALRDASGNHNQILSTNEYCVNYKHWMIQTRGKLPRWWDECDWHPIARVKALKQFKQACIDAGNKEIL